MRTVTAVTGYGYASYCYSVPVISQWPLLSPRTHYVILNTFTVIPILKQVQEDLRFRELKSQRTDAETVSHSELVSESVPIVILNLFQDDSWDRNNHESIHRVPLQALARHHPHHPARLHPLRSDDYRSQGSEVHPLVVQGSRMDRRYLLGTPYQKDNIKRDPFSKKKSTGSCILSVKAYLCIEFL